MKTVKMRLKLLTINAVKYFVEQAIKFEGAVDLSSGKYTVDGKSIMGVFSLDLSGELICNIEGEDENVDAFVEELNLDSIVSE